MCTWILMVLLRCAWLIRSPNGKKMTNRFQTHVSRNGPNWRKQIENLLKKPHSGGCLRQGPQPTEHCRRLLDCSPELRFDRLGKIIHALALATMGFCLLLFLETYHPAKNLPYPVHIYILSSPPRAPACAHQDSLPLGQPNPVLIFGSYLQSFGARR
jgi:hypothetical protein